MFSGCSSSKEKDIQRTRTNDFDGQVTIKDDVMLSVVKLLSRSLNVAKFS